MAEPIEMPFASGTQVGPRNHVLDGGTDPHAKGLILMEKNMPRHARRHSDVNCAKTAEPIEMPFALWIQVGQRKRVLDGAQIPMRRGNY